MKTFLNVLYRRILYKIPLKFLLLLIAIFGILFACFSSAGFSQPVLLQTYTTQQSNKSYSNSNYPVLCIENGNCGKEVLIWNFTNGNGIFYTSNDGNGMGMACTVNGTIYFNTRSACEFKIYGIQYNEYTSLECQTEYNLIPISSVDSNYCQTNNLCPSCPVCPSVPVGTGGYSQLYINNILHLGAPNIIMNIPDEIDWDYAYTQGGQNMNIDVVGYNVDYEKIDSIVQFQNYKPSSEDFQRIISLLAPYTKIIVFFVFLFIIWAWIKKPFKSKKL